MYSSGDIIVIDWMSVEDNNLATDKLVSNKLRSISLMEITICPIL